ncbi:nitrogen fixation protein NifX [Gorillibacterium sp. sgz5001074]|uniref:nitrogen fixation protein NifX n=1 Tax=Gorillibacterium sp. sgz5001074 TaxID=3446695 RepID=UPI003F66E25B
MKVAFATEDGKHVDAHFGRCGCFSVFELDAEGYRWLTARSIADKADQIESDKIEKRVEAVKDCTLVFLCQIGPTAAAKVTRAGVMPLKVEEGTEILGQLARLQEMLKHKPPLWLAKAMRKPEEADAG